MPRANQQELRMSEQEPIHDSLLSALGQEQRDADQAAESLEIPPLEDAAALFDAVFDEVDARDAIKQEPEAPIELSERRSAAVWIVPLVAVAAALVLWLGLRSEQSVAPPYAIVSLEAGRAEVRGADEPERIELTVADSIRMTVAPDGRVDEVPAVAVVARGEDGRGVVRRPDEGVEVDASGSVCIDAVLGRFAAVKPGVYTLEVWIGPEGALPADAEVAPSSNEPSVAVVEVPILVLSEP